MGRNKADSYPEVSEEEEPQRLLGQQLGVAEHDDAVLGSRQSDIETARVIEEANTLTDEA